jgi:hypothetical protein
MVVIIEELEVKAKGGSKTKLVTRQIDCVMQYAIMGSWIGGKFQTGLLHA